jgi:hypothetical protein
VEYVEWKEIRLKTSALAVDAKGDTSVAVFIPVGEFIEVVGEPRSEDGRTVEVRWNQRELAMFIADLTDSGRELEEN